MIDPSADTSPIFLSFRRDDAGHATALYDELEGRFRAAVLFDFLFDPADWVGELIETVRRSALVVALIGTKWLDTLTERRTSGETFSDAVHIELLAALRHEVPVLAVLVDDASLPTPSELPPELSPLADTSSVRLRDASWRQDLDAVVEAIERYRLAP